MLERYTNIVVLPEMGVTYPFHSPLFLFCLAYHDPVL